MFWIMIQRPLQNNYLRNELRLTPKSSTHEQKANIFKIALTVTVRGITIAI